MGRLHSIALIQEKMEACEAQIEAQRQKVAALRQAYAPPSKIESAKRQVARLKNRLKMYEYERSMAQYYRPEWRMVKGLCQLCRSDVAEFAYHYAMEGHTAVCLYWYLRRIGFDGSAGVVCRHLHEHLGIPEGERRDSSDDPWVYVPALGIQAGPYETPELLLVRGPRNSGKTRLAKTYGRTHIHIEADQYFLGKWGALSFEKRYFGVAHQYTEGLTREILSQKFNVVVANTFAVDSWMAPYYAMADACGARVRVIQSTADVLQKGEEFPLLGVPYVCQAFTCKPTNWNAYNEWQKTVMRIRRETDLKYRVQYG